MKCVEVSPDQLRVDQQVTVWFDPGSGQGGRFVQVVDGAIEIMTPMGSCVWALAAIDRIEIEVPFDAEECLEFGDECEGPVEMQLVGNSHRAWPRCRFHTARRWESYENSIERYANSDVPPDGFDPSYAGERWDDDY